MTNCIFLFIVTSILKQENYFSLSCVKSLPDFHRLNDVDKFREILMSTNENVIVSLGKFIYDDFKSRDQTCINTSWNVCILVACFIPILWFLISWSFIRYIDTAWSFIRYITYCLYYSRHHKVVMVSAWQYLYIRSFYLFMCSFYVILHVLYDSWVSYDLFVSIKWLLLLLFIYPYSSRLQSYNCLVSTKYMSKNDLNP